MLAKSWIPAAFFACIIATCASHAMNSANSSDLLVTLRREGASKFADRLESDPETLSFFLANAKTIFAPSDLFLELQARGLASPDEQADARRQGCHSERHLKSTAPPGSTISTLEKAKKLDNQEQKVVLDNRPDKTAGKARRWDSHAAFQRRISNETVPKPLPNMKLLSGLGKATHIIKADIKFDQGFVHITDSYFTRPQSLSNTSQSTGQTTFANLAASGNLTATLDNMHSVTVFVPSNNALSSSSRLCGSDAAQLVSNHVVSGFVGYLPELKDGATLKTLTGETLNIKVSEGRYYVNGALITLANMIMDNGVAHVIDKPLTHVPLTAGNSRTWATDFIFTALGASGVMVAFALI
ncbi:FAS1 domain protein [Metarhizium rileyi]|uniref:FAS1 domain protein n=1 Tax=Metarhizium rileyi (strain RCEF 4871) TaxID=1649241 RepID=A0A162JQI9_METRR|nr:FAS1 domain protein [Metarhizium rileyi RCEF 4871]TWU78496.1 hypothetical protein ED733_008972 [Metarhizium rileyi]